MKIGMYGGFDNGPVKDIDIPYIAIDQGLRYLARQDIKPVIAIGDFDSLTDRSLLADLPRLTYDPVKDDSDTALGIQYALSQHYDEIDIYGVLQGRMDHFLAVLCLLERYRDTTITLYDERNKITLLKGGAYQLDCHAYTYFSVFALRETRLTLRNCAYPLDNYQLVADDPLCLSNQCADILSLETTDDVLFIQAS